MTSTASTQAQTETPYKTLMDEFLSILGEPTTDLQKKCLTHYEMGDSNAVRDCGLEEKQKVVSGWPSEEVWLRLCIVRVEASG